MTSARIDRTGEDPVDYAEAKSRVLKKAKYGTEYPASAIGYMIWPNHRMSAQGLGFAASRFIRRMRDDGILRLGERFYSLAPGVY